MDAEQEVYLGHLLWLMEQFQVCLDGLTAAQATWSPPAAEKNSVSTIARHILGVTRVYALGFGCGQQVTRDRPAEFAGQPGDPASLRIDFAHLAADLEKGFTALVPGELDRHLVPPQQLWGTGEPHEISAREGVVEAIRHAGIHLGEMRLTRDLARAALPG